MIASRAALVSLVVAAGAVGCGPSVTSPVETTTERFAAPEAETARTRAPDMWAAADRAREEAEEAQRRGDARAAADHATRARLLLAAAIAESDRLELEERRVQMDEQVLDLEEQVARDVNARLEIQAEMGRRASARVAAQQAAAAFERAAEDEARRYRGTSEERDRMHREAADILLRRATLLLAAAQAMEASETRVAQVTDLIEEAERVDEPALRIQRAQDAVRGALVVLGEARSAHDGPSADEAGALREAATSSGFEVEQIDRGLVVRVDDAFSGRGAQPSPVARRRLSQAAALLAAHPHGPVQVNAFAAGSARLADARAGAAAAVLVDNGAPRDRLVPEGLTDAETDDGVIWLVFVAYRPFDR